jgi:hypothetical protein
VSPIAPIGVHVNIMRKSPTFLARFDCISLTLGLVVAGCSSTAAKTDAGSGGSTAAGGAVGVTGGAVSSGGAVLSGGEVATGGRSSTSGGAIVTGGNSSKGGSTPSGGSSQAGGAAPSGGKSPTGGKSGLAGSSSGGSSSPGGATMTAGRSATGGSTATGGKANTAGTTATGAAGGAAAVGGATGSAGATITTHCSSALPAGAQPADVSNPTTVVGTGTAASCNFSDLNTAVTKGGIIKFDCGTAPFTIPVTATMNLPTNKDTVIDGGNRITLDGGGKVQILRFDHGDFRVNTTRVTLQRLTLTNAKTTPTEAIPTAPAPCSQGFNDGEGGALYMRDGNLTVIDCVFSNNQAALLGPDTGGGAIYILGSKNGALIVNSVFTNNSASNAAAVGGLFAELDIYDSLFHGNTATGNGANNDDATQCDAINNGQHEIGSGGNGGAIYQDGGSSTNIVLCGVEVTNNAAGTKAFGGGVFMTSNDWTGTLTIQDSTITGNTGGSWTQVQQGSGNLGSAFGVNALSVSVKNSTLQK